MLPETEKTLRQLKRFRPREALDILTQSGSERTTVLKTWALTRLLAWMILDQIPGKRRPKSEGGGNRRLLRTRNAIQAGHWTLVYLLDRELLLADKDRDNEVLKFLISLFNLCGGFGRLVRGRSARGLISQARHAKKGIELDYVYWIISFLCRQKELDHAKQLTIEEAKHFVMKAERKRKKFYGSREISEIWENNKQAAPYIFAFYGFISRLIVKAKSPDQIIGFVEKFVSNQRRLALVIGRAAHAADLLSETKARNVRIKDFKGVTRRRPPIQPFNQDELKVIASYDPKSAIR
jgi:hypothetical protein